MKKLIIGLLALTLVLGASARKNVGNGYPTGANTYPHNTGLCLCGVYPNPPVGGGGAGGDGGWTE